METSGQTTSLWLYQIAIVGENNFSEGLWKHVYSKQVVPANQPTKTDPFTDWLAAVIIGFDKKILSCENEGKKWIDKEKY